MRKFFFTTCFLLFSLFLINPGSQAQFRIDAELRPRAEAWRGYRVLPVDTLSDPLFYISQRTRLNFTYNSDVLDARISLQDVRLWGSDNVYTATGFFGNTASTSIYEAWVAVRPFKHFTIKAGRQELKYDDHRLLWNRNWNQSGLTYDALLLALDKDTWKLHGAFSWNNDVYSALGLSDYPDKLRTVNMIWISKEIGTAAKLTGITLLTGVHAPEASNIIYLKTTSGANFFYDSKGFKAHLGGYYQAGKHKDGREVSAYSIIGTVGYGKGWFGMAGGINYLSGQNFDKHPGAEKYRLFDIFYGARHKYYGYMDYFVNIEKSTMGGGLNDIFLQFRPSFGGKHSIELAAHYFASAGRIYDPGTNQELFLDRYLGSEIDLVYEYSPYGFMKLQVGAGYLMPGASLEKIQSVYGDDIPYPLFGYVQLTVKPTLFKTDQEISFKKE